MNRFILPPLLIASLAVLLAGPVTGQDHRSAIGLTMGGSVHGDLTPGLPATTRLEPGWVAGLQYEYWFASGRTGVRLNTLFTQRRLDDPVWREYNVYMADVDLMIRLLQPDAYRLASPFFAVGVGATHYGSLGSSPPLGDGVYGDDVVRAHLLTSLGVDVAATPTTGLRIEVGDQVVLPSLGYGPAFAGFPNVHNLVATLGVQLRTGSLDRSTVQSPVRPAPGPAPEPAPETPVAAGDEAAMEALRARVDDLRREMARVELWVQELEERRSRPAAPSVEAGERTLYTVQVGSFLEPERADRLLAEVRSYGLPAWRWDAVARGLTFSRIRAGAVESEAEAERLATVLRQQHGLPVWVDEIEQDEGMPAGALDATRGFLETEG